MCGVFARGIPRTLPRPYMVAKSHQKIIALVTLSLTSICDLPFSFVAKAMAANSQENEYPACQSMLSQITGGSKGAKESRVQSCIGSAPSAIEIPQ